MRKSVFLLVVALLFSGCDREADVASRNLSASADNFEILRRVIFYNGISSEYILSIQGYCSIGNDRSATEVTITCKTSNGKYRKHFLGISDNVTYFAEQLDDAKVSGEQYRVIFRPKTIIPDVKVNL